MGKGPFRLLKLALIVAIPVAFVVFSVRGFVVRNAVVTAEISTVRAPIDGEVVESSLVGGKVIGAETAKLRLRNPRSDSRDVDALAAEIAAVLRGIEIRQGTLDWHDRYIAESEEQLGSTLSGMRLDLQLQHEIVLSDMIALKARIGYLAAQYDRAQRLQGSAASQANLDAAAADLEESRARLRTLELTAEQIEQRLAFLDRDLPLADLSLHAVTLADRLADLRIERQATAAELADLESRLAMLNERFDSEQHVHRMTSVSLEEAPPASVVWEIFAGPGANVRAGQPLFSYVDCEARLVEVSVGDSAVELISPGHAVTVNLYGGERDIPGQVISIYGSAAQVTQRDTLAAHVPEIGDDEAVVLIDIPPADESARRHRLCDIGRSAYVEFEGIGFLDPLVKRLF